MLTIQKKRKRSFGILIFVVLVFFCNQIYSQNQADTNAILRIPPGTFIHIRDSISFFSNDTLFRLPSSLAPSSLSGKDKNLMFYNSLKAKASKTMVTKKLYDFVVVTPATFDHSQTQFPLTGAHLNSSFR